MKKHRILARQRAPGPPREREHPAPNHATLRRPWRFENSFGATLVWLLLLGVALNIWPGWTRIGEWLR